MLVELEFCYICFESIISFLDNSRVTPLYRYFSRNADSKVQYPLFITWKKNNELRGCIGTFQKNPLYLGLRKYSRSAAFNDQRFEPIKKEEVPQLTCTVSLLHSFEDAVNAYDWVIGKHGITLTIKNVYSATFLPEVMVENHWTKEETLKQLALKAGYRGIINNDLFMSSDCKLRRYQTSSLTASYEQYVEYLDSFLSVNSEL